jgi:hypothetical protein
MSKLNVRIRFLSGIDIIRQNQRYHIYWNTRQISDHKKRNLGEKK